ncbi:MFS-type transporter SLC18B1-like [Bacillus rossius redtenbacheri]|uniref:MFS-type transporter SLC18B1-like n=1 Tax=Bacillus rossius redtenbacheri TaxID=93214 RepID=UPI002FDDE91A
MDYLGTVQGTSNGDVQRTDDCIVNYNGYPAYDRVLSHEVRRLGKARRKNASYTRSQSMSACQAGTYSAVEISRIRERLLRTQRHPQTGPLRHFTRSQKLTLLSLTLVDFLSFCSMSIMAPFFPKEAALKGMSQSMSGLVFSVYALVVFISSPVFGKILPHAGARFLFLSGMFVAGCCNVLFGLLDYIDQYEVYTLFCFLVRILEALGASAYATASFVFVVSIFPDNIGSVLGILETFVGLGMSVGPALGGLLYSVGGFGLPFYSLGVIMVVFVPINSLLLPPSDASDSVRKSGSFLKLMRLPSVAIVSLVIVVASNMWGFLDPTLEPHLRQFKLRPEQVGLVFLLFSGLYGLFSPLWGLLADRLNNHWSMMVVGLLLCTAGLVLLGPAPFLPFSDMLWLNLVALSLLGISVALALLPTFEALLDSAIEGGCSDDITTYSLVAGVWSCMYSLGDMIGPSLGGVLLQHFGFRYGSVVMAAMTFIVAVAAAVYFAARDAHRVLHGGSESASDGWSDSDGSDEASPLLAPEQGEAGEDVPARRPRAPSLHEESLRGSDRLLDARKHRCYTAGGACEV